MRAWSNRSPGLRYTARLEPHQIGYLCSIVEGHEGLAVVRTIDEQLGIVEFWITPEMRADFESFVGAINSELQLAWTEPTIVDVDELGLP